MLLPLISAPPGGLVCTVGWGGGGGGCFLCGTGGLGGILEAFGGWVGGWLGGGGGGTGSFS